MQNPSLSSAESTWFFIVWKLHRSEKFELSSFCQKLMGFVLNPGWDSARPGPVYSKWLLCSIDVFVRCCLCRMILLMCDAPVAAATLMTVRFMDMNRTWKMQTLNPKRCGTFTAAAAFGLTQMFFCQGHFVQNARSDSAQKDFRIWWQVTCKTLNPKP